MTDWFLRLFLFLTLGFLVTGKAHASGTTQGNFYSETVYDSRIHGAVTDSRFYNYWGFFHHRMRPYGGFHFTRDLTNSRAPEAIENAFMPTLGLELNVLKIPYLSVFSEYRWIFRSEPNALQSRQDKDLRFGLLFYLKEVIGNIGFVESYGEWVQIDRVSSKAALASWVKLGKTLSVAKKIQLAPFAELFTRQSPDLGYGPTENEFRLGARLEFSLLGLNSQLLLNTALLSNIKPGGWDALFVLSKQDF